MTVPLRLNSARASCLAALVWLALAPATGAEPARRAPGGLRGSVTDPSGAAVPGASVEARAGARARTRTDAAGEWALPELPAGAYRVTVSQPGFARFEREGVKVVAGQTVTVDAELAVARVRETVDVREGREGAARAGALVLEGALLDALPDDPGEMLAALAALAGAAPGHAPPVLVDGFEGGRVPPKAAIRMVRLNASPYSAEYEYPGLGRIEIFTKPGGGDGVHGSAQARLGGKALDARDPFASGETPDYRRLAGGAAVGGPLVPGRASFFLDLERAASDEARLVNALVLGPGLVPASRNESFVAALTRTTVSPRFDAQVGGHTLTARYAYSTTVDYGAGVGAFALPSRAFTNSSRQHLLQAGDTFSLGRVTHELRAQWSRQLAGQEPEGVGPSLVVEDAFASGGADAGPSRRTHDRFELHDVLAWASGAHGLRAGVRLRHGALWDESRAGWSGTVTFGGGVGPALDAGGRAVLDAAGLPVLAPLTSLERYRRTLALRALGLSPAEVRELGGGASLLEVAGGEARASVGQWDLAGFVQDEWRVREDLTVGLGVRAEAQPDLGGGVDAAPRASFSWTPGRRGAATPATVVRGGVGLFYERVGESLFLDAQRLDGASPRRFAISDPAVLDLVAFDAAGNVSSVPAFSGLATSTEGLVTRRIAAGTQAPATLAASLSLDRSVSAGVVLSAQWSHTTTWRALRSRVVAPAGVGGPVVYQYESTGRARQDQVMLGATRFGRRLSLSARYFLSFAYGDTDGPGRFPASSADPRADWSRASGDVRHRLVVTGSVALPFDLRLSPFLVASSGVPYDVTVGRDLDGDTVFADRPAYATDTSRPGLVATRFGLLDPAPEPGVSIVPRNLGQGPGFLSLNVRLSRAFALAGRGGHGTGSPRALTVSLYAQNVFDRVNADAPVGSLASPYFGRSLTGGSGTTGGLAGGHRSVELQVGTSF